MLARILAGGISEASGSIVDTQAVRWVSYYARERHTGLRERCRRPCLRRRPVPRFLTYACRGSSHWTLAGAGGDDVEYTWPTLPVPGLCRFCMRAYNGVARKNNATTNVGRNTGRSNGVRTYVDGARGRGRRRLRMLRDNCSENIYASYRSNGTVETVDDPACVNARPRTKTQGSLSASDGSERVKRRLVNFNRIPFPWQW